LISSDKTTVAVMALGVDYTKAFTDGQN